MPRVIRHVPTSIYMLHDPAGMPFYCGKTMRPVQHRFHRHLKDSLSLPDRPVNKAIIALNNNVTVDVIDIVPADQDWRVAERFWIATLRYLNPCCTNMSAGGDGVPGHVPNAATRARLGAAHRGKKLYPHQIELLRRISTGRIKTPEEIEKTASANRGRRLSPETIEKMRRAHKGKIITAEAREKMRLAKLEKRQTPEHIANMRAAVTGKPKSEAHKAAVKAALVARRERLAQVQS